MGFAGDSFLLGKGSELLGQMTQLRNISLRTRKIELVKKRAIGNKRAVKRKKYIDGGRYQGGHKFKIGDRTVT